MQYSNAVCRTLTALSWHPNRPPALYRKFLQPLPLADVTSVFTHTPRDSFTKALNLAKHRASLIAPEPAIAEAAPYELIDLSQLIPSSSARLSSLPDFASDPAAPSFADFLLQFDGAFESSAAAHFSLIREAEEKRRIQEARKQSRLAPKDRPLNVKRDSSNAAAQRVTIQFPSNFVYQRAQLASFVRPGRVLTVSQGSVLLESSAASSVLPALSSSDRTVISNDSTYFLVFGFSLDRPALEHSLKQYFAQLK